MNTLSNLEAQNVGLAIPSTKLQTILESYARYQQIVRVELGADTRMISSQLREQEEWLPVESGEIIYNSGEEEVVEEGSVADKLGLKKGDIIVSVNGESVPKKVVQRNSWVKRRLLQKVPGEEVKIRVLPVQEKKKSGWSYASESVVKTTRLDGVVFDLEEKRQERVSWSSLQEQKKDKSSSNSEGSSSS
jgi:S1-C subfamily serine protease